MLLGATSLIVSTCRCDLLYYSKKKNTHHACFSYWQHIWIGSISISSISYETFSTDVELPKHTAFPFSGGETSGLNRVKEYIWDTHHVDTYKETRNDLIGPEYSTKFSAWFVYIYQLFLIV